MIGWCILTPSEVLKNLCESSRQKLNYAFERDLAHYELYAPGKFIGVNCERIKHLVPNQVSGKWSIGDVKR